MYVQRRLRGLDYRDGHERRQHRKTQYNRVSGTAAVSRADGSKFDIDWDSSGLPTDETWLDSTGATIKEIKLTNTSGPYERPATAVMYLNGVKVSERDTQFDGNANPTQTTEIDWARDSTGNTKRVTTVAYLGGSS